MMAMMSTKLPDAGVDIVLQEDDDKLVSISSAYCVALASIIVY